jgi:hypothetical protein
MCNNSRLPTHTLLYSCPTKCRWVSSTHAFLFPGKLMQNACSDENKRRDALQERRVSYLFDIFARPSLFSLTAHFAG